MQIENVTLKIIGGAVDSWLVCLSPGQAVQVGAMAQTVSNNNIHFSAIFWLIFGILGEHFWIFDAFLRFNWLISTLKKFF